VFDENDEIGFVLWKTSTGKQSRSEWELHTDRQPWLNMAREAILRMRVLMLVDEKPRLRVVK
jgi:hypothetical protein